MNKKSRSWLQVILHFVAVSGGVTIVSFGSVWVGLTLWSFFRKPPAAPKGPASAQSAPMERPSKKETPPEAEGASPSLVGDSKRIVRVLSIDSPMPGQLTEKQMKNTRNEIRAKQRHISEITQRILQSHRETKGMEDYLKSLGFSQALIQSYPKVALELASRNAYRADIRYLQNEIKILESTISYQRPTLEEAASPAGRRADPVPHQILASSRTTQIRRIGSSSASTRSTGSSESEIPRIGAGED